MSEPLIRFLLLPVAERKRVLRCLREPARGELQALISRLPGRTARQALHPQDPVIDEIRARVSAAEPVPVSSDAAREEAQTVDAELADFIAGLAARAGVEGALDSSVPAHPLAALIRHIQREGDHVSPDTFS